MIITLFHIYHTTSLKQPLNCIIMAETGETLNTWFGDSSRTPATGTATGDHFTVDEVRYSVPRADFSRGKYDTQPKSGGQHGTRYRRSSSSQNRSDTEPAGRNNACSPCSKGWSKAGQHPLLAVLAVFPKCQISIWNIEQRVGVGGNQNFKN